MKIILGSSSPRRKTILESLIEEFEIRIPEVNEKIRPGELPRDFSERISREKAEALFPGISGIGECALLTCDTIVNIGNQIMGKPSGFQDAIHKIKTLNGKTHEVISSMTIYYNNGEISSLTGSESSRVNFKKLTESKIIDYLSKFDYMDKAGAYAVQDYGGMIIESIEGSLSNVIGFPLRLFYRMINEMNIVDRIFE